MVRLIYKLTATIYILLIGVLSANAQCVCTNCPQDLPDNTNQDFFMNVADDGSATCDLNSNPLIGISLNFTHEYLGDLTITLTSPSGESIMLVGPQGYYGTTHYMCGFLNQFECPDVWDMEFADGAPAWNSNTLTLNATASNSGTYSASDGKLLSSFSGNACGTWAINVTDGQAFDTGEFVDFGLSFDNDAGLNCTSEVPLPIEIVDFEGKKDGKDNLLTWTTLTETNNDFFLVQRSVDGIDYTNLGEIKGSGTTFSINNYSFVDRRLAAGTVYYRLKQTDFDGTVAYSLIVSITRDKNEYTKNSILLTPNPVISNTTLELTSIVQERIEVLVTDINGKVQEIFTIDAKVGGNFLDLDFASLSSGIYFIRSNNKNHQEVSKFVKM